MAGRPRETKPVDWISDLTAAGVNVDLKMAELPDERASRLRREEAEDAHKRRLSFLLHCFAISITSAAFVLCLYIVIFKDPKTGLPDKAIGVITAIVAAGSGYITGRASK